MVKMNSSPHTANCPPLESTWVLTTTPPHTTYIGGRRRGDGEEREEEGEREKR